MTHFIELWSHWEIAITVLGYVVAVGIIFLERKNPESTLAWTLVLLLVPMVGIFLYIIFSQNISRMKLFRLKPEEENVVSNSLAEQIKAISEKKYNFRNPAAEIWQDMIRLNQIYDSAYFTQNNSVEILSDGTDKFGRLLEDIRNAKEYINIEYFIVKDDEVGNRLIDELTEKALAGVKIRFIMDGLGSRQIVNRHVKKLRDAGGSVEFFFRPRTRTMMPRFNYRNHRKLVAIDGKIGYIGGYNVATEYLGRKAKFGYWRDTHARITGDAVIDINVRFFLDWRYVSNEDINIMEEMAVVTEADGNCGIQIVTSGPDSTREEIKRAYMKMITSATKCIYLQTPYFVPDSSIHESLKMAALSGVDVRVMIPCKPDHLFVYWATYWYVGDLLRSGVKVYIYDNGFLHAKTLVADGQVASVGSANFDNRSFKLNFEANAFVYDEDVAEEMMRLFEKDMELSHELTKELYARRSWWIKVKENLARLLSNIL